MKWHFRSPLFRPMIVCPGILTRAILLLTVVHGIAHEAGADQSTAAPRDSRVLSAENDPVHQGGPDFLTEIRPLLSSMCFRCHGPDDESRAAELRLDQPDGLFRTRDGRSVVVRGDANSSELIQRILSEDPDVQMPPAAIRKSLTAAQKQMFVDWVNSGAEWQPHWAFVSPQPPALPEPEAVQNALPVGWSSSAAAQGGAPGSHSVVLNEIDVLVLEQLARADLRMSVPAAPETQLRRLFLDLIGIPPTVDEADRWLNQIWGISATGSPATAQSSAGVPAENAGGPSAAVDPMEQQAEYERLVDHLLARPEYGERWARRWMDLARYADTNGYEKDRPRTIWPWRDWVIQAINDDMPFDQFTIEQLAGDMLPDATVSQRIATGFHRNTMVNEEGGIDPLEFRFYAMTDRVATTGTVWLGLTLGCAQCHTHKYDPVSQREYYQLMALMNNVDEPSLELPDVEAERRYANQLRQAEQRLRDLPAQWPAGEKSGATSSSGASAPSETSSEDAHRKQQLDAAFADWLTRERKRTVSWQPLRPLTFRTNLPHLRVLDDLSVLASGDTTKQDRYEIQFDAVDFPVTALLLEALPDERLPGRGPGLTWYEGTAGDFYLTELQLTAGNLPVTLHSATESYAKNQFGNNPVAASLTLDGDIQTGWSVFGAQGERHTAVFIPTEPVASNQPLVIRMSFGRHFASSLGRFRFLVASERLPGDENPVARRMALETERLLLKPEPQLTAQDREVLFEEFLLSAPQLKKQADEILRLRRRPGFLSTLVLQERPPENPRPTWRYHRGEYLQPREQVQPGVLKMLHQPDDRLVSSRLDLARWLMDSDNPLTARVTVNRHWAAFFGRGIVVTEDDFGLQGSPPVNQKLLDWLAVTLMDDGWSLKRLHRRIVTSAVYRQSAAVSPDALRRDPENSLLAYAPRFRLDAEILRDSILQASGLLTQQIGGPPVRPPQPPGITEVAFGRPGWNVSEGADRYRRSLYTEIKRTAPFAMVTTFDGPSGESCIARRNRSNSPLQALTLLNDIMFLDIARQAGLRLAAPGLEAGAGSQDTAQSGDASTTAATLDERRCRTLFRSLLTRQPQPDELQDLLRFLADQRHRFLQEPRTAAQLMLAGPAASEEIPVPDSASEIGQLAEQAAWTALARGLYALDEVQVRP